jgi:hypothetical protein
MKGFFEKTGFYQKFLLKAFLMMRQYLVSYSQAGLARLAAFSWPGCRYNEHTTSSPNRPGLFNAGR